MEDTGLGGEPNEAAPPPATAGRGWLRRALPYVTAHRRDAFLCFGAAIGGLTVTALTPLVQKLIVDDVVLGRRRSLAPWLVLLVVAPIFAMQLQQNSNEKISLITPPNK